MLIILNKCINIKIIFYIYPNVCYNTKAICEDFDNNIKDIMSLIVFYRILILYIYTHTHTHTYIHTHTHINIYTHSIHIVLTEHMCVFAVYYPDNNRMITLCVSMQSVTVQTFYPTRVNNRVDRQTMSTVRQCRHHCCSCYCYSKQ